MPSDLAEPILTFSRPSKRNLTCSIPSDYIPLRQTANSSTGECVGLSFFDLFRYFALHVWNLIRRDFISLNSLNVDRNTPDEILALFGRVWGVLRVQQGLFDELPSACSR